MKKVLIVDNSSYMRLFVKKIIQKEGSYTTLEASNKEEAIEVFKAENPSMVILDLNMDENTMEGMKVLSSIIQIDPEAVVIIMSAVASENVKYRCKAQGAKHYITKPVDTDVLLEVLNKYK